MFIQDLFVWECMRIHEAPNFMSIAPRMLWVSFTVAVFAPRSLEKPCWRSQTPTTRRLRYVGGSSVYRGHSRALSPRILLAVGVMTEDDWGIIQGPGCMTSSTNSAMGIWWSVSFGTSWHQLTLQRLQGSEIHLPNPKKTQPKTSRVKYAVTISFKIPTSTPWVNGWIDCKICRKSFPWQHFWDRGCQWGQQTKIWIYTC